MTADASAARQLMAGHAPMNGHRGAQGPGAFFYNWGPSHRTASFARIPAKLNQGG